MGREKSIMFEEYEEPINLQDVDSTLNRIENELAEINESLKYILGIAAFFAIVWFFQSYK